MTNRPVERRPGLVKRTLTVAAELMLIAAVVGLLLAMWMPAYVGAPAAPERPARRAR